jgi:hypothetical protein
MRALDEADIWFGDFFERAIVACPAICIVCWPSGPLPEAYCY